MNKETRLCPRCNKRPLINPRIAISRRDNKTEICSECGQDEALFDFDMNTNNILSLAEKDMAKINECKWLNQVQE